jgi:EAL domain-containing protein (putative c-di-GMP-specific phosphodiesterase class I)
MKVGVAIDDFGVGYSSLSRLRSLPISMVKIDRRFVDGIADPANFAVVRSITDLAAALGLEVTAEGIETPHQREKVRAAGCDRGQGFLFARAIPEAEFVKILLGARTPQLPVGAARVPADLKGGQP